MNFLNNLRQRLGEIKGLGFIGFGDITGIILASIFWFYLASVTEPNEYGDIHFFLSMATIGSSIALFGTQDSITVLTAKGYKIQSGLNIISLGISSITSLFLIIFFQRIDVGIIVIAFVINTLSIGDLLGKKQFFKYSQYNILQKILTLVLGIGFFYAFGPSGIIYALAISYAGYLIRIIKTFQEIPINFKLIKEKSSFLSHNYIMYLAGSFGSQLDKIIVVPLLGSAVLGNYSLALQVITVFTMFTTILFKFLLTQESSGIQNRFLIQIVIIISVIISILGIFFSPLVIPNFFPKYVDAGIAIQIMSLSIIPITIITICTSRLLSKEKSKLVLIGNMIGLIIIILGILILGSMYGTIGIAMSFVLSSISKAIYLGLTVKNYERGIN
jgi:O-antigen/teichoic acid export membrane protein